MKQGGTALPILQALALSIREILTNNQITLTCQYIPGMQNTTADDLSRKTISLYEQQLPLPWFQQIRKRWKDLAIDAFAAHHNHLLPTYWIRYPDPGAAAVNAFEQQWPKKGLFLNPSWKLIPKVTHKLKTDQVSSAVLVTPRWPTQAWWPMILPLAKKSSMVLSKLQQSSMSNSDYITLNKKTAAVMTFINFDL